MDLLKIINNLKSPTIKTSVGSFEELKEGSE